MNACRCRDKRMPVFTITPIHKNGDVVGRIVVCITCEFRDLQIFESVDPAWKKTMKGMRNSPFNRITVLTREEKGTASGN